MKIFLVIGIVLVANLSVAQIRSQLFYSNYLSVNPALTASFNKDYRFGTSFLTENNSTDQKFKQISFFASKKLSVSEDNQKTIGVGGFGVNEQSQEDGLTNTTLMLSGSYQMALNQAGSNMLSLGFQAGLNRRKIEKPNYIFEDQLIKLLNAGFENIDFSQFNMIDFGFLDINTGLNYQFEINPMAKLAIGIAVLHVNKPAKTFNGGNFNLSPEIHYTSSFEHYLLNQNTIFCSILFQKYSDNLKDFKFGSNYSLNIAKKTALIFGLWGSSSLIRGTAICPTFGFRKNSFQLLSSYKVNTSTGISTIRSGGELNLIINEATSRRRFDENTFISF